MFLNLILLEEMGNELALQNQQREEKKNNKKKLRKNIGTNATSARWN